MKLYRFVFLAAALILLPALNAVKPERWVVYYTDKLPSSAFENYDLIVFDADIHPHLLPLKAQGKTILGYISLGEAESYRGYFNEIKKKKLLLKANHHWKGHYIIDVRKQAWQEMVLDELIPPILAQGFDGIMIDTIDSVTYLEVISPKKYGGMQKASADLIKAIRARYPDIKIMLNRGFEILPQVASDIDMVMAESIYTTRDTKTKKPKFVQKDEYQNYLKMLNEAKAKSPKLKICSINYWLPNDKEGIKKIYSEQRAQGFIPYVSTDDLQNIVEEPK